MVRALKYVIIFTLILSVAWAQWTGEPNRMSLSGPRAGLTLITGKTADRLEDELDIKTPIISQFGWHFEKRFFSIPEGPTGVVEFIPLIGGMENNIVLPSVSMVVGLRGVNGREIGVGPNVSVSGIAYVVGGGVTRTIGMLNIPTNFSVVFSNEGVRLSILIGFNSAIP